ncbi:MAG TPA: hypothetical protein H9695_03560 [Candidatus Mediterraneibacter excrementigallinarum]|nr:hypothetical protein [Candidatus Mediterraneibacter excrementigallinarum]
MTSQPGRKAEAFPEFYVLQGAAPQRGASLPSAPGNAVASGTTQPEGMC